MVNSIENGSSGRIFTERIFIQAYSSVWTSFAITGLFSRRDGDDSTSILSNFSH